MRSRDKQEEQNEKRRIKRDADREAWRAKLREQYRAMVNQPSAATARAAELAERKERIAAARRAHAERIQQLTRGSHAAA